MRLHRLRRPTLLQRHQPNRQHGPAGPQAPIVSLGARPSAAPSRSAHAFSYCGRASSLPSTLLKACFLTYRNILTEKIDHGIGPAASSLCSHQATDNLNCRKPLSVFKGARGKQSNFLAFWGFWGSDGDSWGPGCEPWPPWTWGRAYDAKKGI